MKKIFGIVIVAVLILMIYFAAEAFLIGDPVDSSTIFCNVEETDSQLTIRVYTTESAVAFTDVRYQQDGTTMYITFQRVLVSPIHSSGEKCIYLEKCDLTEVYVCEKPVWSAP